MGPTPLRRLSVPSSPPFVTDVRMFNLQYVYVCSDTRPVFVGAPREILDAGKTLVAYIEAVKKEYDVRSFSLHGVVYSYTFLMGVYVGTCKPIISQCAPF